MATDEEIAKYQLQAKAYIRVLAARRKGQLPKQPCSICGNPEAFAHHEDYSKPLDVIWLCHKHHMQLHAKKYKDKKAQEEKPDPIIPLPDNPSAYYAKFLVKVDYSKL